MDRGARSESMNSTRPPGRNAADTIAQNDANRSSGTCDSQNANMQASKHIRQS